MEIEVKGHVPVTGDCGHKFEVPIARIEDDFTCPECGHVDRFSEDQIRGIRVQLNAAVRDFGTEHVRKELDKTLRDIAARSKHITYKPKR